MVHGSIASPSGRQLESLSAASVLSASRCLPRLPAAVADLGRGRRAGAAERGQGVGDAQHLVYLRTQARANAFVDFRPADRPAGSGAPHTGGPACQPPRGPPASARPARCRIPSASSRPGSRPPAGRRSTSARKRRLAHQRRRQLQRGGHRVVGVEQGRLVLLQVAIVRQRQPLHQHQQLLQIRRRPGPPCRGSAPARPGSSCAA